MIRPTQEYCSTIWDPAIADYYYEVKRVKYNVLKFVTCILNTGCRLLDFLALDTLSNYVKTPFSFMFYYNIYLFLIVYTTLFMFSIALSTRFYSRLKSPMKFLLCTFNIPPRNTGCLRDDPFHRPTSLADANPDFRLTFS